MTEKVVLGWELSQSGAYIVYDNSDPGRAGATVGAREIWDELARLAARVEELEGVVRGYENRVSLRSLGLQLLR